MNRSVFALPALVLAASAHASVLIDEMSLHVMLESSAATLATLGDYTSQNPDLLANGSARIGAAGIRWSGSYADSGWSYSGSGLLGGLGLTLTLAATVAGAEGSNIVMSIVGSGSLGTQPLQLLGSASWLYDTLFDDYFSMDFVQQTKIGAASRYGAIRGNENYGCVKPGADAGDGSLGGAIAGAPVVLSAIASLGKKSAVGAGSKCFTPADVDLSPGLNAVASSGKRGGLLISRMLMKPLSPTAGAAPDLPAAPVSYLDFSNQASLVQQDGQLDGDDLYNRYRSSGRYANGSFSGITQDVPEPGTLGLLVLALSGLMLSRRSPAMRVRTG